MDYLGIIEKNREKFLEFNELKQQRFQELMSPQVRRVINAIPLLLSVNSKKLPGYVDGPVACGISGYAPDDETVRYFRARFPATSIDTSAGNNYIEMLAVMGSVGTVAYNKKSDFDYWVCVDRHGVPAEQYNNLLAKVDAIQRWAIREIEVPVHLFVNDISSIRRNIFAEDDEEGFGSTIGAVLKDEFFRSSIIIAGKIPFWWVLPHFVKDEQYAEFFERLPDEMRESAYLDLGNLYEISREDFLGSALFQIIKSLGNPFKSIIKIGVLEKYLFGGESTLISQKLKMNILHGTITDIMLDAYLFMFEEVYSHYSSVLTDISLLNTLRQNLYLKVDPQISRYTGVKDRKNIPYRVRVMLAYVRQWDWNIETIRDLDNFDNWDFTRVMAFWDNVKKFMLLSYQNISAQIPGMNLQHKISESDFKLLSRKITTHFRSDPDKIEQLITFKDTPAESILYMEPVDRSVKEPEWRLSKRDRGADSFSSTTIKTSKSILSLIAWMALNKIYDPNFSRLNIQSGFYRVNQNSVVELLNEICAFFSGKRIQTRNDYYLKPEFTLLNMVIINFNLENTDGIKTVHHLYHTSWGESYLREYTGEGEIAHIVTTVVRDGMKQRLPFDSYCKIIAPESYRKHYKRIISFFRESYAALVEESKTPCTRFITSACGRYHIMSRYAETIEVNAYQSPSNFYSAISLKPRDGIRYHFTGEDVIERLAFIMKSWKRNAISVLYEETPECVMAYLVNETGNPFIFTRPLQLKNILLSNLCHFCDYVTQAVNTAAGEERINGKIFRIMKIGLDQYNAPVVSNETARITEMALLKQNSSRGIHAEVEWNATAEALYRLTFPDGSERGPMRSGELFGSGGGLRAIHSSMQEETAFIDGLKLAMPNKKGAPASSTRFFLEKYKLELLLEKELRHTQ